MISHNDIGYDIVYGSARFRMSVANLRACVRAAWQPEALGAACQPECLARESLRAERLGEPSVADSDRRETRNDLAESYPDSARQQSVPGYGRWARPSGIPRN